MAEFIKRAVFLLWFPVGFVCRLLSIWDGAIVMLVLAIAAFILLSRSKDIDKRMKTVLSVSWGVSLGLFCLSIIALIIALRASDAGTSTGFWEPIIGIAPLVALIINLLIGAALLMRFKKSPIT